jgi:hypothetical protein
MQTALSFTRPRPDDLFKAGSQNHRLYNRLLQGPLTNVEGMTELYIINLTGRISDIREALKPHLMDIKARRKEAGRGIFIYEVTP